MSCYGQTKQRDVLTDFARNEIILLHNAQPYGLECPKGDDQTNKLLQTIWCCDAMDRTYLGRQHQQWLSEAWCYCVIPGLDTRGCLCQYAGEVGMPPVALKVLRPWLVPQSCRGSRFGTTSCVESKDRSQPPHLSVEWRVSSGTTAPPCGQIAFVFPPFRACSHQTLNDKRSPPPRS